MSASLHTEQHANSSDLIRNFLIGFSDSLTGSRYLKSWVSTDCRSCRSCGALSWNDYHGAWVSPRSRYGWKALPGRGSLETDEVIECPLAEDKEEYDILDEYGIRNNGIMSAVESLMCNPEM